MRYVEKMVNAGYIQVRDEQGNIIDYSINVNDREKARQYFNDLCNTLLDDGVNGLGYQVYSIDNDEGTEFSFLFSITFKQDYINNIEGLFFKGGM
jgi:GH35 family endo-1,4-beta-xylanase